MRDTHEVLLLLLLDLAVIIVAARALGAVARRFRQPSVIGEIVAGMLLGPTVLGRIAPALPAALFPPDVPLRQIADLGLIFFMFLVGLELDPRMIRREGRRAATISLAGLVPPFALGALLGIPLLAVNNEGRFLTDAVTTPTALTFSLFLGASMSITAFPVLARILVERGLYKSPLGTTALCAAAVDDVVAWILLAVVVGLARSGSGAETLNVLVLTALFAGLMFTLGRRALGVLARRHEARGHLSVDDVAIVVVGLLLSAYATEAIGIHSIFGAFVFGAIMPRDSGLASDLTDKLEDFTVVVLLPVFFCVAGLRTNLFAIESPALIAWLLAIVAAAIVGKLAGCGIAARVVGFSRREALVLGTLMNTRGLTELVILSLGLSLGVLSDRTFAMMVVMALVTTVMAAPIINLVMPRREMVRMLSGGEPNPVAQRVLVAVGNPDNARALVDAGTRLADAGGDPAEVLLVRLIATPRAPEFRTGLRDEESQLDRAMDAMERLSRQAGAHGISTRAVSFLSDDVGHDLAEVALTQRCTSLVLGWHRASLSRDVLVLMLHRVLSQSRVEVVVFVDRIGEGLVAGHGAPVLVVGDAGNDTAALEAVARRVAAREGVAVRVVPSNADVAAVSRDALAMVVAIGTPDAERAAFGPTATAVAEAAACPVLVVRQGDSA